METLNLEYTCDYFSTRMEGNVLIFQSKGDLIENSTLFECRDRILEYFDYIEQSDEVKVILMKDMPSFSQEMQYQKFIKSIIEDDFNETLLLKMCRAFDQFILRILSLKKIIISLDSTEMIPLLFNVRLACDFRFITPEVSMINLPLTLNLIPKGGSFELLRARGVKGNLLKPLLLKDKLTSDELLDLKMVDFISPASTIEADALEVAHKISKNSSICLAGMKQLNNSSLIHLEQFFREENKLLVSCLRAMKNEGKEISQLKRFK